MEMITIPKTEIDQVLKALEIAKAEIGRLNRIIRGNRRQLGGKCMSAINLITEAEALKIIETRRPIGLFMAWEGGKAIGIDNSTGDAWTEEFPDAKACTNWLLDEGGEA